MSKRTIFLICIVFVLGMVGRVHAVSIDVNNYSFEWMADGSYVDAKTGDMDDVMGWESYFPPGLSTWIGVDCLECEGAPELSETFVATDGNIAVYGQNVGTGTYQIFDHIIEEGQQFTVTFDAMSWDLGDAITPRFFYVEGEDPCLGDDANLYNNEMASERIPIEPQEWGTWLWITDLTLVHTVLPGEDSIGNTLGVMFEFPETADENRWRWGGLDNIRLGWVLATSAYGESPKNGSINVELDAILSWVPGIYASSTQGHDVYFGTSFEEVNEADTDSDEYKGRQDANVYDPNIVFEIGQTYYWRIDEFNNTNVESWKGKIWSFKANDGTAFNPVPEDGADMVPVDEVLGWVPGIAVTTHQVYFGTSLDDVNDADDSDTSGIYRGESAKDVNYYAPQVPPTDELILGQDYYWRVDEVNDANLWRGQVWTFRAQDYHVIDDMERYGGDATLWKVWTDGAEDYETFSEVFLNTNIFRDKRSMEFHYQNQYSPYYSRAYALTYPGSGTTGDYLPLGRDWTVNGTESLALWFYGQDDNAAAETERMCVVLEDTYGEFAEVPYSGDMRDIRREEWQEWNIAFEDFLEDNPSLNLASIEKIYINVGDRNGSTVVGGEGWMYFDDVRLHPSRCVPKLAYASGSFDGDCVTDYFDLAMMADDWLLSGRDVVPDAPSDQPLIRYEMEDGAGTTVTNTGSGTGYNGTFGPDPCDPAWTAGYVDGGLRFDNDSDGEEGDFVSIPALDIVSNTLSITAWIKRDGEQVIYSPIVFTRSGTTAGLGLGSTGDDGNPAWAVNYELCYHWADAENSWSWHNGLIVPDGVWTFIALTVAPDAASLYMTDLDTIRSATNYVDHQPEDFSGTMYLCWDTIDVDVNNPTNERHFEGVIDDVRVYTRTLSDAEVLGVAGLSGSHYIPLESWRTDSDKDDDVDIKDYAIMADYWLEETLFPIP